MHPKHSIIIIIIIIKSHDHGRMYTCNAHTWDMKFNALKSQPLEAETRVSL